MSLVIRPAALTDAAELFALVSMFPTPTPPSEAAFMATLEANAADTRSFVAVAAREATLIGYVAGYRHPTFYANGDTAWVDEVLVAADHRRTDVGRRLMEAFETWATQHGCRLVGLATAGACGFYEHLGYNSKAGYYKKYLNR